FSIDFSFSGSMLYSAAWNCDGTQIVTGSEDRIVSVGTIDLTGKFRQTLVGATHWDSGNKVAWHSSHPSILASASADRSLCIWDTRQKASKPGRLPTKAQCTTVAWSPCGQYLVLGDERLSLVDERTFTVGKSLDLSKAVLNEFVYDTSGKHLIVALGSGKI
ncbi:hypothetical protein PFISCL1PPCAC_21420, partial [Pristionchus fissidentatus]